MNACEEQAGELEPMRGNRKTGGREMPAQRAARRAHASGKRRNTGHSRHESEDLLDLFPYPGRSEQAADFEVRADRAREVLGRHRENLLNVPGGNDGAGRQHCSGRERVHEPKEWQRAAELARWRQDDEERNTVWPIGEPLELILLINAVDEPPDDRQPSRRQFIALPIQVEGLELIVGWREKGEPRCKRRCDWDEHRHLRVEAE